MNAYEIMQVAQGQSNKRNFIPQLTTGTMPKSQGSSVSQPLPQNAVVAKNAVPTPYGMPWTTHQNQRYPVTANAKAPWVIVPLCSTGVKPKSTGLALMPHSAAALNLPAKHLPNGIGLPARFGQ